MPTGAIATSGQELTASVHPFSIPFLPDSKSFVAMVFSKKTAA
jgi:hypothetical protein